MSEVYESMEYIMEEKSGTGMITKPSLNVHSQRLQSDNFFSATISYSICKKELNEGIVNI